MASDISAPGIDLEEVPQSRQRKKLAKQAAERKKSVKPAKEWFEQSNNRIIKKVKMSNGNVHTIFVGMVNKKNAEKIAQLKKKHDVKVI